MGKHTGVPETEAALSKLTNSELEAEIWLCKLRARIATDTPLRSAFEKRVLRLERVRMARA
jgi:hypothetical protein